MRTAGFIVFSLFLVPGVAAQTAFVNWETPHVHPLALTPDGLRLLAVNTADARLEVFQVTTGGGLIRERSISVGLDPVSVRPRGNGEAWVVNHISDSISIVDLNLGHVRATLQTLDEPCDVVFAGSPVRAFVSCSQANTIQVFDPQNLSLPPINIPIDAEDPRALAVSPDGLTVYAAIFESGNATTILGGGLDVGQSTLAFPPNVVSDPNTPYGGVNPPPNAGSGFNPPLNPNNPPPPPMSLIVRKDAAGAWRDDNGVDWTPWVSGPFAPVSGRPVGWDMPDYDVAMIDTTTLGVSYASRLMNLNMAIAVNPATGAVATVGTNAINEVRFEPVVAGRFIRVHLAQFDPGAPAAVDVKDLNPHLDYQHENIPPVERVKSIGDPRGLAWNSTGSRGYVAGMGSNSVVVINSAGDRAGLSEQIFVGEGPTGLAVDDARQRLFVLNKFDATISIVSTQTEQVVGGISFYDPTPVAIRVGRPHLYDTQLTSGLGHASCAACHIDGRMDRLAWDLGDPSGGMKDLTGLNLGAGIPGLSPPTANPPFLPFQPMKGPMTTQTLQDIIGHEPHHWRGDRLGLEEFNPAFVGLNGRDAELSPIEMQQFEDFLATITFPPNPFRNFDNTLPTALPLPGHTTTGRFGPAGQPLGIGNALNGMTLYRSTARRLDGGVFACVTCHTLPTGTGTDRVFTAGQFQPIPPGPNGERHHQVVSVDGTTNRTTKTPQLRNLYDKVGFTTIGASSRAGFGFLHDGSVDTIERFVAEPVFTVQSDQEIADIVAFMLSFSGSDLPAGTQNNVLIPPGTASKDSHAAVGRQTTVLNGASIPPQQSSLINSMLALADANKVGVVARGRAAGLERGFVYLGSDEWQSDRAAESLTGMELRLLAAPGSELTYTVVPIGTQVRIGIDRDADGYFDRDELDACSDPADPSVIPGGPGSGLTADLTGDGIVDQADLALLLSCYNVPGATCGDIDGDNDTDQGDLAALLASYGAQCPQ